MESNIASSSSDRDPAPDTDDVGTATPGSQVIDGLVVRPDPGLVAADRLPGFVGISATTVGAQRLAMGLAVIPPGAIAPPHLHEHHETGIYLLAGLVELRWGDGLAHRTICQAGDFVLTPAGQPHQPRNLSDTETAVVVFARSDPREHEDQTPYATGIGGGCSSPQAPAPPVDE